MTGSVAPSLPHNRFSSRLPAIVAIMLAAGLSAQAQERRDPATEADIESMTEQQISSAIVGLEEESRLSETLIELASRAHRVAAAARNGALQALERVQRRLDELAENAEGLTSDTLGEAARDVDRVRAAFTARDREAQARAEDLRRLLGRREALSTRIAALRSRLPSDTELLTGVWEVRWFPAGVTGTFTIDQSGTLVTGQYALRPIGTGSLQGTFVSGKLYLQRIDRQRGRDAELEGYLDPDGKQIRGTWQSYELVQGGIPHGQWVARRVK